MQHLEVLSDVAHRAAPSSFRSRAELLAHFENSFTATVMQYSKLKTSSPIVASCCDPDGLDRSERLTPDAIEYLADIENATRCALRDKPQLEGVWFALALGQPTEPKLAQQCMEACGRVYAARGLEPWKYHQRDRYPKRRAA